MEECWLCPKYFASTKALRLHILSREHRRHSVICPWCPREERTFTRVADLAIHCQQRHFATTNHMAKSVFSIPAAYYMAIYPEDYARITEPAPWDSLDAIEVRRIMSKWFNTLKNPAVKSDNWRRGWRNGLKVMNSKLNKTERRKPTEKKKSANSEMDFEINRKNKVDENTNEGVLDLSLKLKSKNKNQELNKHAKELLSTGNDNVL